MFFKQTLQKEIQLWIAKDFVSKEQANKILNSYNLKLSPRTNSFSIINILGYFFLGLSIIVLIGHNWENIPVFLRAGGLISLTFTIQSFAFYQFYKKNKSNLFFLGNFIYGASIILIAQAYHLGTYMPDGIFWWALGSFLIALHVNNKWVSLQAFILSLIWYFMEVQNFYPWFFWLFLFFCLWILYKDKQNNLLCILFIISFSLFYLYSLSFFLYHEAIQPHHQRTANIFHISNFKFSLLLLPIFAYFGLLFSAWLTRFASYKDYAVWFKKLSLLILYVSSFFLLAKGTIREFMGIVAMRENFELFAILAILLTPIIFFTFFLKAKKYQLKTSLLLLFIISFFYITNETSFIFFVCINIVIFGIYSYIIYEGIVQNSFSKYFLGIFALLLFALIRYISLIDDYISASFLFLVCAIILLLASYAFKRFKRKYA